MALVHFRGFLLPCYPGFDDSEETILTKDGGNWENGLKCGDGRTLLGRTEDHLFARIEQPGDCLVKKEPGAEDVTKD